MGPPESIQPERWPPRPMSLHCLFESFGCVVASEATSKFSATVVALAKGLPGGPLSPRVQLDTALYPHV
jgi:hypothetical protein